MTTDYHLDGPNHLKVSSPRKNFQNSRKVGQNKFLIELAVIQLKTDTGIAFLFPSRDKFLQRPVLNSSVEDSRSRMLGDHEIVSCIPQKETSAANLASISAEDSSS